jgi:hypothetical protein
MSLRVAITISDPWDLVTVCGSGPFQGTVAATQPERLVVQLDEPLRYQGHVLTWAVCQVRHEGGSVDDMVSSHDTPTSFALVSAPPSTTTGLRDVAGVAALGTVRGA